MPNIQTAVRSLACATLGAVAAGGAAQAAGLERTVPQVVRLLYEPGKYAEFGVIYADPDLSGDDAVFNGPSGPVFVEGNTGDMLDSTTNWAAAFKGDINERFSFVLGFDQPFGVNTTYGQGSFPSPELSYAGTQGELNTYQLTAVLAYDVTDQIKVYGGLRAERLDANADVPFVVGYSVSTDENWGYGYLVGASWSRPEKAQRVALTYHSEIKHDLDASESFSRLPDAPERSDGFEINTPQSVTLDFQSGVAPKTLVFGSIRWVNWADFSIVPPFYEEVTGIPLVDYEKDWWTYQLGVGRQLTDALSGSFFVTYEPSVDEVLTALGPVDGRTAGTVALNYDYGQFNFTGALSYGWLGEATDRPQTEFSDGTVWAAALRVGYSF
jgi:long-chain fatty acid transport protein